MQIRMIVVAVSRRTLRGSPQRRVMMSVRVTEPWFAESGRSRGDRLIYERVRLGILSALCVHRSMTFGELKKLTEATTKDDGDEESSSTNEESTGETTEDTSTD